MTLDPCQLPANYTTKIATVKRYIVEKIDNALGTVYSSVNVSLIIDFGILKVNNVTIDGLTNRIKQVFGDVPTSFINQARADAISAAITDYQDVGWTSVALTTPYNDSLRYCLTEMDYSGPCPIP